MDININKRIVSNRLFKLNYYLYFKMSTNYSSIKGNFNVQGILDSHSEHNRIEDEFVLFKISKTKRIISEQSPVQLDTRI